MGLTRVRAAMLARDNHFNSRAAAEAAALGSLGVDFITVYDGGEDFIYRRDDNFADLTGADLTTWRRTTKNDEDLIALVGDIDALLSSPLQLSGDWTPTLSFSGGGGGFTYAKQFARSRANGAIAVHQVAVQAQITALGSGNLRLYGMPVGLTPMAGAAATLRLTAKGPEFFVPYGASDINLSWTPGSSFGVFNYYSAAGYRSQHVTGITGTPPVGDYQAVSWAGGDGRLVDVAYDPGSTTSARLVLVNVVGSPPSGTLTGAGWTATAGAAWGGAPIEEQFLTASNLRVGQDLNFTLEGSWIIT